MTSVLFFTDNSQFQGIRDLVAAEYLPLVPFEVERTDQLAYKLGDDSVAYEPTILLELLPELDDGAVEEHMGLLLSPIMGLAEKIAQRQRTKAAVFVEGDDTRLKVTWNTDRVVTVWIDSPGRPTFDWPTIDPDETILDEHDGFGAPQNRWGKLIAFGALVLLSGWVKLTHTLGEALGQPDIGGFVGVATGFFLLLLLLWKTAPESRESDEDRSTARRIIFGIFALGVAFMVFATGINGSDYAEVVGPLGIGMVGVALMAGLSRLSGSEE